MTRRTSAPADPKVDASEKLDENENDRDEGELENDEDGDDLGDEPESDEPDPEPKPARKPKSKKKPRARKRPAKREEDEDAQEKEDEQALGEGEPEPPSLEEKGPSPLEAPSRSPDLIVNRVYAHGPSNGFPEGDDFTGPCPSGVAHRWNYEREIWDRWGGGDYEVTGIVKGKAVTKRIKIGGPSKPVNLEEEVVEQPYAGPFRPYGPPSPYAFGGGFQPGGFQPGGFQPGGPSFMGGLGSFAGAPGYAPFGVPQGVAPGYGGVANAWHQARPGDSEQTQVLRDELEIAKEKERQAREEAKIASIQAEADKKDAERQRQLDQVLAQVKGGGSNSAMSEWLQMQQQRIADEAEERKARREAEDKERKERTDREAKERQDRIDKEERERKDRLDREDREAKAKREHEERIAKDRAEEAKRQEGQYDRLVATLTAGQMKPTDQLKMLVELKNLAGGGGVVGQIKDVAEAVAAFEDLRGGKPEAEGKLDQAGRFLERLGGAFAPAIREGKSWWEAAQDKKQQNAGPAPGLPPWAPPGTTRILPGPVAQPVMQPDGTLVVPAWWLQQPQIAGPPPAAPGAPPQIQGPPNAPSAQANQVEAEAAQTGVSPAQWGKILEFVVDAATGNSAPEETAQHLLTTLKAIDAMPALESLATSRVVELKGRVNLLLLSGRVKDPEHKARMESFCKLAEHPQGVRWLEELLKQVKSYFDQIQSLEDEAEGEDDGTEDDEDGDEPETPAPSTN